MSNNYLMVWIAVGLPLLSFLVSVVLQYWTKRAYISTIVVFGGTFAALKFWFGLHFWSFLLLYVLLCWLGCWVAVMYQKWRQQQQRPA